MIYMLTASEIVSIREFILDIEEYHDLDEYQERALQDVLELLMELTPIETETFINYIEETQMNEQNELKINVAEVVAQYEAIVETQGVEAAEEALKGQFGDEIPQEVADAIAELLAK